MDTVKGLLALLVLVIIISLCNITAVSILGDFACNYRADQYVVLKKTTVYQAPIGRFLGNEKYGEMEPGDIVKITRYYPGTDTKIWPCKRDFFWRTWVRISWGSSPTHAGWVVQADLAPTK